MVRVLFFILVEFSNYKQSRSSFLVVWLRRAKLFILVV